MQLHISQPLGGDILAFFTGQEEIELAMESLLHIIKSLGKRIPELILAPIYAALPSEMQASIFLKTPPGSRKVTLPLITKGCSSYKYCRDFDYNRWNCLCN